MAKAKKVVKETVKKSVAKRKAPKAGRVLSTEIVVLLDRSGSMESIRTDMVGGFNTFIAEQRKIDLPCTVTLWQFDHNSLVAQIDEVYAGRQLADVPGMELVPRGGTPLLDAIGTSVTKTAIRHLNGTTPDKVVFMVITDGQENSSREWTKAAVKSLIESKEKTGWAFTFLGANVDAFAEAGGMGVRVNSTANFMPDSAGVRYAYEAVGQSVGNLRSNSFSGDESVASSYSISTEDTRVQQAPPGTNGTVVTSHDIATGTTTTTLIGSATTPSQAGTILGSLGNSQGGYARAEALTPKERSEIARKGGKARWEKK